MSSKQETAQQLRKVVNFVQGLSAAADALEAIGSLEQAAAEANRARNEAFGERDKAQAELTALRAALASELEDAKKECAELKAKAKAAAEKTTADKLAIAESKAAAIVAKAVEDAQKVTAESEKARQVAANEVNGLKAQAEALASENARAAEALEAARSEHDKLTTALADLRARIGV